MAGKTQTEPISEEERNSILAEVLRALEVEGFCIEKYNRCELETKILNYLVGDDIMGLIGIRESLDRYQFLTSKAITGYLDQLVKESRQSAKRRFSQPET